MNYINFFMYLMCNFKYFCKNYRFCIYTVVMGNNIKKKKKKKKKKKNIIGYSLMNVRLLLGK